MVYSAHAVANAFIALAKQEGKKLTNMQVQKLVFLANGFMLAIYDRPLYWNDTKAWQWGPVIPRLYKSMQKYGNGFVTEPLNDEIIEPHDAEAKDTINGVWVGYGQYTGIELSAITHKEDSPWSQTWKETKFGNIPQELISNYYKNLIQAA